jgi:hypothetical protein
VRSVAIFSKAPEDAEKTHREKFQRKTAAPFVLIGKEKASLSEALCINLHFVFVAGYSAHPFCYVLHRRLLYPALHYFGYLYRLYSGELAYECLELFCFAGLYCFCFLS